MKIKGTPTTLLPFFQAHSYLPQNNVIQELSYMQIICKKGILYGLATNLTNTIVTTCDCAVEGEGIIIVNVALICDYLSKLPASQKIEIEYHPDKEEVTIECKGAITAKYNMNVPRANNLLGYLKEANGDMEFLDIQDFEHHVDDWQWDAIKGILFVATAQSAARPILSGINISMSEDKQFFELAATDSVRAAILKVDNNGDSSVVKAPTIPKEIIKLLSSFVRLKPEDDGELSFAFIDKGARVRFRFADNARGVVYYVFGLTISGTYPNVRQVFPNGMRCAFRVNKDLLVGCFQRVQKIVKEANYRTTFEFDASGKTLTVISGKTEVGSLRETIKVEDHASPASGIFTVSVSSNYFEDLIKKCASSEVVIDFPDDGGAVALYEAKYNNGDYSINKEIQAIVVSVRNP